MFFSKRRKNMCNCYYEDMHNKSFHKDKRLCEAIINVSSTNVIIESQIINSILESIMSIDNLDKELLKAS